MAAGWQRVGALVTAIVLTATGCGAAGSPVAPVDGSVPSAAPVPSPTAPTRAAVRALSALQASVADLGAAEVSGGTSRNADGAVPLVGRRRGVANLRTHEFSVVMQLGRGAQLKMLRQADMTWTKAPGWYWMKLGYDRESARAANGKWVAAGADGIKALVEALDPGAVVQALLALRSGDGVKLAPVRSGGLRGNRVLTFRQAGAVQRIFLSSGPRPSLLRITSTSAGVRTTVDFVRFPKTFHVELPHVDDVLQAP